MTCHIIMFIKQFKKKNANNDENTRKSDSKNTTVIKIDTAIKAMIDT